MTGGVLGRRSIHATTTLQVGDQVFGAINTPEPLILDSIVDSNGIDVDVLTGEFTIKTPGIYNYTAFPNFFKTSGGQGQYDIWLSLDKGAGWVDEPNTSSRTTLLANTNNTDLVATYPYNGIRLQVGWKVRFMAQIDDAGIRLATIEPPVIPAIPANIVTLMFQGL